MKVRLSECFTRWECAKCGQSGNAGHTEGEEPFRVIVRIEHHHHAATLGACVLDLGSIKMTRLAPAVVAP